MKLNEQFAPRLEKLGIRIADVLLPVPAVDLKKWSVIACDQYTSDHEYWNSVEKTVGGAPSTLRLTLPEIYLETSDVKDRIAAIHANMSSYLTEGLLQAQGESIIYVQRTTAASGLRQGIVVAMDLEKYSYAPDSKSLIRATEGTIVDRIPPRLQVRRQADLELPHIMILINDPRKEVIEGLAAQTKNFSKLYDLELMADGGTLRSFRIEKSDQVEALLAKLEALLLQVSSDQNTAEPLFFAMGDGNHSLATAKALWEEIKAAHLNQYGSLTGLEGHPARFALAEIVNIHSPGLRFEPIHRAIFTTKVQAFNNFLKTAPSIKALAPISEQAAQALLAGADGQNSAVYYDGTNYQQITFANAEGQLPPALIDGLYQAFTKIDSQARVDFIHGWNDNKKLASNGAVGFFVPVIARERLFNQVQNHGPLPRKAFSMGDAEEKRYYMEARRITR